MSRFGRFLAALGAAALASTGCAGSWVHAPLSDRWLVEGTGRLSVPLPEAPPDRPLRIAVYGDCRGNRRAHRAVLAAVRAHRPDLVVFTGDALDCLPGGNMPDLGPAGLLVPLWP